MFYLRDSIDFKHYNARNFNGQISKILSSKYISILFPLIGDKQISTTSHELMRNTIRC